MEPTPYRTEPVSFTRRGGRLTERQSDAWDKISSTYVLQAPTHGPSTSIDPTYVLDRAAAFGREAPLVVEIGSGRGEAIVRSAQDHPE
ncbi:MAG: tRNA (guanosine(46)-N7)-methyltransferase TrmB, partial [Aeromicrobium sp.]